MKKTILTLLFAGLLSSCEIVNPLEPQLQKSNTTPIIQNPISKQDLILNIEISYTKNLNYRAKLQNSSGLEIKLDNSMERDLNGNYVKNGYHRYCIEYKIMQGNREILKERNESDMIVWLKNRGYIETQAKDDTLKTFICNAKVDYWKNTYEIPYPLKIGKTSLKEPIKLSDGEYNFEIDVNYSINDTLYNTSFFSDEFKVGIGTGIVEDKLLKVRRIK